MKNEIYWKTVYLSDPMNEHGFASEKKIQRYDLMFNDEEVGSVIVYPENKFYVRYSKSFDLYSDLETAKRQSEFLFLEYLKIKRIDIDKHINLMLEFVDRIK